MEYVHRIKKYIVALAAVLALLQTGCTPVADADMLAYQRSAAHAEVKGCFGDTEFGALIELSAMPSDGSPRDVRAVRVEYTSPSGLEGIAVMRTAGKELLTYSDLELPGDVFAEMLAPADAFSLTGTVLSAETVKSGGGTYTVIRLDDGAEVTIDSAGGHPVSIVTCDGMRLEVIWYEADER